MRTNSICCLVALIALFAFAGCDGGGGASKDAFVQGDGTSEEPGTNPFLTPLEEEESGDPENGNTQSDLPETKVTTVDKVTITTKKMKDGLFGEEYTKDLKAKGGSKEYTWVIAGGALPQGLALEGETIQGTPTQVGEFSVALSVSDKNDPTQIDSKSFSFAIKEDLAIDVFIGGAGDSRQQSESIDPAEAQTVAWVEKLIFEVKGHSENYAWEISDAEAFQIVSLANDRIKVEPKNKDADVVAQNLSVTVTDAVGSQEEVKLSSVTFKGDPCKVPLSITINSSQLKTEELNTITTMVEEPVVIALKVSGGIAPYKVETDYNYGFDDDDTCHWNPEKDPSCRITESVGEDGSALITMTFTPVFYPGLQNFSMLSIEDGCSPSRKVEGTIATDGKIPQETIEDIQVVFFTGEIHDTGSNTAYHGLESTWLSVLLSTSDQDISVDEEDKNFDFRKRVIDKAAGEVFYSLAECNDVSAGYYADRKCATPRSVTKTKGSSGAADVTSIKDIALLWHDHGDSDVDVDIHLIIFYTKYRYTVYFDEGLANKGGAGNAFDDDVVDHTWRYDNLDTSAGMAKDNQGNIWFERQNPYVPAEFDFALAPYFLIGKALWGAAVGAASDGVVDTISGAASDGVVDTISGAGVAVTGAVTSLF